MAWQNKDTMALKEEFLEKYLSKVQSLSSLCRDFDISRKTAYKWIDRFKEDGVSGLASHSKRPLTSPARISNKMINLILSTRKKFPSWGCRKLRQYLLNEGIICLPSESTFNRILLKNGEIDPIESEKRTQWIRFERAVPNELWQMDFKGHFKLLEEGRCHPLTILDDHSRFSIYLKGCKSEDGESVKSSLEDAFRQFGMPEEMTMDNGSPWKGHQFRLSKLTVWLMRLGIKVSHSAPYHPQTQGKLERFHRSLKEEVLKYHQFGSLSEAQERFDEWRYIYNNLRPHEGIGMACPSTKYQRSLRSYPEKLPEIEYDINDAKLKVRQGGTVYFKGKEYWLGQHFAGEYVSLKEVGNETYDIFFSKCKVQRFKLNSIK